MGPDSELRLMLYSKWCLNTAWIVLRYGGGRFWNAAELVARHSAAMTGFPITYTYSARDLRHGLLKALRVKSISKDHIFPSATEKDPEHEYPRVWGVRWLPASMCRALERWLGWHTFVVATREPVR